jgi:tripartite-type tricarboxylate transporter receptor subunit TctC
VPELPDVPTVKESGVPELKDFSYNTITGLFGPAKMPPEILKKLHDAMVKTLTDPATVKRFADLTATAKPSTPEELAAMFDHEDRTAVPLIRKLGIKSE